LSSSRREHRVRVIHQRGAHLFRAAGSMTSAASAAGKAAAGAAHDPASPRIDEVHLPAEILVVLAARIGLLGARCERRGDPGEGSRLDTMPSKPMRQACSNTRSPRARLDQTDRLERVGPRLAKLRFASRRSSNGVCEQRFGTQQQDDALRSRIHGRHLMEKSPCPFSVW